MVRRVHLSLNDPRFASAEWIEQLAANVDERLNRGSQRIVFTRETAAVLPYALRLLAHRHLSGTIALEAQNAGAVMQRTELLASGKSFEALKAAYDIMALTQPGWIVTLRRGTHVLRCSTKIRED